MLYRFGYVNGLNFVLPRVPVNVGWPHYLRAEDYLPLKDGYHFDALVDHTVYHRRIIDNLMPADTAFIAMLRYPLHHLKSVFSWYKVPGQLNLKDARNPLETFLRNSRRYQENSILKELPTEPRSSSLTRNFMAYDLGYPPGLADDMDMAQVYVQRLDSELDLVMILEYLDESLVLLKRTMCWSIRDILYDTFNEAIGYRYNMDLTPDMDANYRKWSKVDYLLYEHFNNSLWKRISQEGDDFHQEVEHFVSVNSQVKSFCEKKRNDQIVIPASKWDAHALSVNQSFCHLLQTTRMTFYKAILKRQRSKLLFIDYGIKPVSRKRKARTIKKRKKSKSDILSGKQQN
ncbi:galactosylceramide sulfotransferase-like [Branchiostoma floridae]|uniref:Galactosylceramide sulfotransferase-like n=1 Tax=Branchiostoma floridae TaxID=7739 RepID=A0A9J7KZR7_BRAFL|nr:galactosylceramide sulfotransferase-like [Branchiostoma floridae]